MQEYECEILGKYNIDVVNTKKVRGAILCSAVQGQFLLKEVPVSKNRLLALDTLYHHLQEQFETDVDYLCPTKEGELCVEAEDGKTYMLRRWHEGRECDVKKTPEVLAAAGNLAKLHKVMYLEIPKMAEGEMLKEEYERHNRELRKVRQYIRKMTTKGKFEMAFLEAYEEMERLAELSVWMLKKSGYQKLYREQMEHHSLIHGEYNYHNIWILEDESQAGIQRMAITNFDKFKRQIQIEDLYYFLRKVMEKCGWKERLGDHILNAYSAVRPLSKEELEYLNIRLIYPEKFWKVANSFYYSNKAWTSAKNVEKIENVQRQTKEKERFIKNLFSDFL